MAGFILFPFAGEGQMGKTTRQIWFEIVPSFATGRKCYNIPYGKNGGVLYYKSNRKAMNRNWSNQKANPALKTKAGNK